MHTDTTDHLHIEVPQAEPPFTYFSTDSTALWTDFIQGLARPNPTSKLFALASARFIALGSIEPKFYAVLREQAGLSGPEWDDHMDPARWAALKEELASIIATRTRDEWCSAMEMATAQQESPVVLVGHDDWHEGVIGIVAGRLREALGKPACVVALGGQVGKGDSFTIQRET